MRFWKSKWINQERYKFNKSNELHFDFISKGRKGEILKRVTFHEIPDHGFYNMGLWDVDTITGEIDYYSITDNGDRDIVLATVSDICDAFFELYPQYTIYFKGTTASRTRLYQMAINHYFDEISEKFHILGELEDKMTRFAKNNNYQSFLILKK